MVKNIVRDTNFLSQKSTDMNEDDKVDILDVKLLLQAYINS